MPHMSEYEVESRFIERLESLGYTFAPLNNYDDVLANFRLELSKFNAAKLIEAKGEASFTDAEFKRVLIHVENKSVYCQLDLSTCPPQAPRVAKPLPKTAAPIMAPGMMPTGPVRHTPLYYNPVGGEYYHRDQNCKRVHELYLPLQGQFTYAELNKAEYSELKPCEICNAPSRPEN